MKRVIVAIISDESEAVVDTMIKNFRNHKRVQLTNSLYVNDLLKYGNIEINYKYRTVKINEKNVELTNYEFEILYLLANHPGQVFSKKQIYEQVWNLSYLGAEDNVVSLIHRIRKKIEPNLARPVYIFTVGGYKFNGDLNQSSAP